MVVLYIADLLMSCSVEDEKGLFLAGLARLAGLTKAISPIALLVLAAMNFVLVPNPGCLINSLVYEMMFSH